MTREEHYNNIKDLFKNNKSLMLKLPTSFGKSKIAIDLINDTDITQEETLFESTTNVLIVVPRLVLIDNWKAEIAKWKLKDTCKVTFTTYVSFPKHAETHWNFIIFDEGHHFTDNCADAFISFKYDKVIFMSATFPKQQRFRIKSTVRGISEYTVTARDAITDSILPDPKVILVPMMLDNTKVSQILIKNKSKSGSPVKCFFKDRFSYQRNYPNRPLHIYCTQQEYYNELNYLIDFWKQKFLSSGVQFQKNLWLRKAKDRLDWLALQKEKVVEHILSCVEDYRTLTFCTSIEQTERLGKYPVNSKNAESKNNLEMFNTGQIKHITSVGMLNEGVNLLNCQIGIYANIGSSEIIEIQRLGRILRVDNPLIIIPFYVGTREEEIVSKMIKNYNPSLMFKLFTSQLTKDNIKKIYDKTKDNN